MQDHRIEKLSESDAGAELKSLMAQARALESTKAGFEKDSTAQSQRVEQLLLSERKLQQEVLRDQQAAESDAGVMRPEKVALAKSVDEKGFELDRIRLELSLATQQRVVESAVAAKAKAALAVLQDQRVEKRSESDAGAELKSLMAQARALESTKEIGVVPTLNVMSVAVDVPEIVPVPALFLVKLSETCGNDTELDVGSCRGARDRADSGVVPGNVAGHSLGRLTELAVEDGRGA